MKIHFTLIWGKYLVELVRGTIGSDIWLKFGEKETVIKLRRKKKLIERDRTHSIEPHPTRPYEKPFRTVGELRCRRQLATEKGQRRDRHSAAAASRRLFVGTSAFRRPRWRWLAAAPAAAAAAPAAAPALAAVGIRSGRIGPTRPKYTAPLSRLPSFSLLPHGGTHSQTALIFFFIIVFLMIDDE